MGYTINKVENDYSLVENFLNNSTYQNFMQLPIWGEFKSDSEYWNYQVITLNDENNDICGCAMIQMRKVPLLKKTMWYIPRGFVVDFNNYELVKIFAEKLIEYGKINDALVIKIDPLIEAYECDIVGNRIENGNNNEELVKLLGSSGFKHQGYFKDMKDGIQPRNTMILDLREEESTLQKSFKKGAKNGIKIATKSGITVHEGDASHLPVFYEMLSKTAEKSNFLIRKYSYFEKLYRMLAPKGYAKLFYAQFDPQIVIDSARQKVVDEELKLSNFEKKLAAGKQKVSEKKLIECRENIVNAKNKLVKLEAEYKDKMEKVIVCSAMLTYTDKTANYLFSGSDNKYLQFQATHLMQWEMIKDAKNNGKELYDFIGVLTTNPDDKEYGVYLFKSLYTNKFVEGVGEFDAVIDSLQYKLYRIMVGVNKNIRKPLTLFLRR